jgi:hypothetical protein
MHTVGLGFLVGISAIVDLRVLGVAPQIELAPLEKLFPVMYAGFWMTALSGVLLWMADATTMTKSPLFVGKLALIFASTLLVRMLKNRVFNNAKETTGAGGLVKVIASASLLLWLGAVTAGRLTAYLK